MAAKRKGINDIDESNNFAIEIVPGSRGFIVYRGRSAANNHYPSESWGFSTLGEVASFVKTHFANDPPN